MRARDDDDDYDIGPVVALQHVTTRLRRKARAHERLSRILIAFHGGGARTEAYHEGAADALEAMAERIERGDA